jgi:hypothetical protein
MPAQFPCMPKCRTPNSSDPRTRVPQINGSDPCREIAIAISLCKSFTTPETPISRTPNFSGISRHVSLLMDGSENSRREIANRDSNMQEFYVPWKTRCSNPDSLQIADTCPVQDLRLRSFLGISGLMKVSILLFLMKTR